ncbi:hypothetical protein [Cognatishimia maritima]|uniref:PepSY domain-containing protein n=1 Tax=Cognatishimia maritima TaxID=870908 RepID=A0A1M5K9A5_9RHOB|nr:hypothetical protein [Cognatishimia maritima]SHG49291.1 hypothetical protein SAMN04488044_0903 [Cognatishimia maritima]
MKKLLITTTALTFGMTTWAAAQSFAGPIVTDLLSKGYTDIEIETEGSTTVIEATFGDMRYEYVYDTESEDLLETEIEPLSEDDDDDDDDHDEDDDHDGDVDEEDDEDEEDEEEDDEEDDDEDDEDEDDD